MPTRMSKQHPERGATLLLLATLAGCAAGEGAVAPPALTLAAEGAGNPTLALDERDGSAVVAWVQTREGESNVYAARVAGDGTLLGGPARVNQAPGDASLHEAAPPQVAIGPGGEVYVAWESSYTVEGRQYPASNLRFARSVDGGLSYGATVTVNSDAAGIPSSHTFHDLAVAPDGTIFVAWLDSRARDRARLDRAGENPPAGAHGAHGHAVADELPGTELWVAHSRDGGLSFSEVTVVDRGVCPCCRTALATSPDGAVYVAWRRVLPGDVRDIAVARSDDGGRSFAEPVLVNPDGWVFPGCPHAGPSLAVANDGSVHVAWYTGKAGAQGLFYAASSDRARSFAPPRGLVEDAWVPPSSASVATRGDEVWLAWDDRRRPTEERQVFLGRLEPGDGGRIVREAVLAGSTPELAFASAGGGLAWQVGDAVQFRSVRGER